MQRLLKEMEAVMGDSADLARCITEIDTHFGYWWCYQPASHHPGEAIEAMIHIAKAVADAEARNSGKTYVMGSVPFPESALISGIRSVFGETGLDRLIKARQETAVAPTAGHWSLAQLKP